MDLGLVSDQMELASQQGDNELADSVSYGHTQGLCLDEEGLATFLNTDMVGESLVSNTSFIELGIYADV